MLLIILGIIAGIYILIFLVLRKLGGGKFPWLKFYVKGRESGFSFKEINLLRKVAVENRLDNPLSLFWSIKQLDRSIRGIITKFRARNTETNPENAKFLSKLFDFRKQVEFNLPKYKLGLKTTRKISPHQKIKMSLNGGDSFHSSVVENLRKYLAVSYPKGNTKLPPGFSWRGKRVNIYFWRPEDAGYVFETKVLEDYIDKKYPILHLSHSDNLIRSQKRKSVRVPTNMPAQLYPLKTIDAANEKEESAPGLRCRLMDISEDGAAILIGGQAKVGLPIKFQYKISNRPIIMCGIVKGINFNQKKKQSILHIQAVQPSFQMKNAILSYVYNLFGEQSGGEKDNKRRKIK